MESWKTISLSFDHPKIIYTRNTTCARLMLIILIFTFYIHCEICCHYMEHKILIYLFTIMSSYEKKIWGYLSTILHMSACSMAD